MLQGCKYDKIRGPNIPRETASVVALYNNSANQVLSNSPKWEEANFTKISLSDLTTGQSYGEEYKNANGTIDGISGLGGSKKVDLTLKALYDDEYIYILAQWNDSTLSVQFKNWVWEDKWLRTGNTDQLILKFDMGGNKDVWHWSAALSAPMGYALDGIQYEDELRFDEGDLTFETLDSEGSKPAFEWNGESPVFTKPSGVSSILDPAYFMAGTTVFIGEPVSGKVLYAENCMACHGNYGETGFSKNGYGVSINPVNLNRWSRETINDYIRSDGHDGTYISNELNNTDEANLVAYMRGVGGIPGFRVREPSGSVADVEAQTFLSLVTVNLQNTTYKVMFKRKLQTGMSDDIQFDPAMGPIQFDILLSDNDDMNFVGALNQKLMFLDPKY